MGSLLKYGTLSQALLHHRGILAMIVSRFTQITQAIPAILVTQVTRFTQAV